MVLFYDCFMLYTRKYTNVFQGTSDPLKLYLKHPVYGISYILCVYEK